MCVNECVYISNSDSSYPESVNSIRDVKMFAMAHKHQGTNQDGHMFHTHNADRQPRLGISSIVL